MLKNVVSIYTTLDSPPCSVCMIIYVWFVSLENQKITAIRNIKPAFWSSPKQEASSHIRWDSMIWMHSNACDTSNDQEIDIFNRHANMETKILSFLTFQKKIDVNITTRSLLQYFAYLFEKEIAYGHIYYKHIVKTFRYKFIPLLMCL